MSKLKKTIIGAIIVGIMAACGFLYNNFFKPDQEPAKDGIGLHGELTVEVKDSAGNVKDSTHIPNTIVNNGLEYIARLTNGTTTQAFNYIQIASSDALTTSSTALVDFVEESTATTSYVADYTARLSWTFNNFASSPTIRSAGIFNDVEASTPIMLAGQTFADKAMEDGDTLQIIWDIIFSR